MRSTAILGVFASIIPAVAFEHESTTQKPAATIQWQFSPPYYNPLHMSLFNFLGWQNIGALDDALPSMLNDTHPTTMVAENLDILLPTDIYPNYLLNTTGNTAHSMDLFDHFLITNPPSSDKPWYLVLKVIEDGNTARFREKLLDAIPAADIQRRYTKIKKLEELRNEQKDTWHPHITLGRIVNVDDSLAFGRAILEGFMATSGSPFKINISKSNVILKSYISGKKGKLLQLKFDEASSPELYQKFRYLQNIIEIGLGNRPPPYSVSTASSSSSSSSSASYFPAATGQLPAQISSPKPVYTQAPINPFVGKKVQLPYPPTHSENFSFDKTEALSHKTFADILNDHYKNSPYYILAVQHKQDGTAHYYNGLDMINGIKPGTDLTNFDFFTLSKYRLDNDLPPLKLDPTVLRFNDYVAAGMNQNAYDRAQKQLEYGLWTKNQAVAELFLRWYLQWFLLNNDVISNAQAQLITQNPVTARFLLTDPSISNQISRAISTDKRVEQAFKKWLKINSERYRY